MAGQNPFAAGQPPFALPGMMQLDARTLALAQQQLQLQQQLHGQSTATPSFMQTDAGKPNATGATGVMPLSKATKRSLDESSQAGDHRKSIKAEADSTGNNSQTTSRDGSPGPGDETAIDKRKRNCLASARFRQKKKAEMQMLEEIAAAKTEECEKLQQSVKLLQAEVTYLKQLMFMNALANAQNPAMLQALATQNPLMAAQAAQLTAGSSSSPSLPPATPGGMPAMPAGTPRLPAPFPFAGMPGLAGLPMGDLGAQLGMQQAALAAMGPLADPGSLAAAAANLGQFTPAPAPPKP